MKYKIIRYPSTWEIFDEETKRTVMAGPIPYNPDAMLNKFFMAVTSCKSEKEVTELYRTTVEVTK